MEMYRRCRRSGARAVRENKVHTKTAQLPASQGRIRQTQFLPFPKPCWLFCTWQLDLGKIGRCAAEALFLLSLALC